MMNTRLHTFTSTLKTTRIALVFMCSCLLFLPGCDTTFVDPFDNNSQFYTIYGYINGDPTVGVLNHAVRIIPITRRAEIIRSPADPQANIDARVFLVNTATGAEREFRHSLERLSEDRYGHIFSSSMSISQNTTYRLEVRREDGMITSAETKVPNVSTINAIQDEQPIIDPATGRVQHGILIPGITQTWNIDFIYYLGGTQCLTSTPVPVSYGRSGFYTGEGWRLVVNASEDLEEILSNEEVGANLVLCAIGIETQVPDDKWVLPTTQAGVDSLAFSNIPSNVENGLGFFGSIGVIKNTWKVPPALQAAL